MMNLLKFENKNYSEVSSFSGTTIIEALSPSIRTSHLILSPCSKFKRLVIAEGITVIIDPAFLRILVRYVIFILRSMFFSMYISIRLLYKYLTNFLYKKPYSLYSIESLLLYRSLYRFLRDLN